MNQHYLIMCFPLWSFEQKDPFGVYKIGLDFVKFGLNNMDVIAKKLDPHLKTVMKLLTNTVALIPFAGAAGGYIKTILDVILRDISRNFWKYPPIIVNFQQKILKKLFLIQAETIPDTAERFKSMKSLQTLLEGIIEGPIVNGILKIGNKGADLFNKINPLKIIKEKLLERKDKIKEINMKNAKFLKDQEKNQREKVNLIIFILRNIFI